MFNDNVLRRPDGRLTYVDVGGAGPYRAQGEKKGGAFGPVVHELESFMEFMPEIYQGMTKQEMIDNLAQTLSRQPSGELERRIGDVPLRGKPGCEPNLHARLRLDPFCSHRRQFVRRMQLVRYRAALLHWWQ